MVIMDDEDRDEIEDPYMAHKFEEEEEVEEEVVYEED